MNVQTNELVRIIDKSLDPQITTMLLERFQPFLLQANEWKSKAHELVVTDVSQTEEMKQAREARLALRNIRINADRTRKELKEDSLRYGKAVQSVYNVIEAAISPIEDHLEKQEKFKEIHEKKQREALAAQRQKELEPYKQYVPYAVDLGSMSEDDFRILAEGAKLQHEAAINRERLRKEQLEKEAEERKRQLEAERNIAPPPNVDRPLTIREKAKLAASQYEEQRKREQSSVRNVWDEVHEEMISLVGADMATRITQKLKSKFNITRITW